MRSLEASCPYKVQRVKLISTVHRSAGGYVQCGYLQPEPKEGEVYETSYIVNYYLDHQPIRFYDSQ